MLRLEFLYKVPHPAESFPVGLRTVGCGQAVFKPDHHEAPVTAPQVSPCAHAATKGRSHPVGIMGSRPNSSPNDDKTAWEQLNPFRKYLASSALLIVFNFS